MGQIFFYLSATDKGFNLMKLQGFEDLRLGKKFSFRSVLCIFLRNLRPGHLQKAREEQTITVDRSNGEDYGFGWHAESGKILEIHPEGLIHEWNERVVNAEYAGDGKPVRVDDKIMAVNCIREISSFANEFEKKQEIEITVAQDPLSFIDQLKVELEVCKEVVTKDMKLDDMETRLEELVKIHKVVENSVKNECGLFKNSNGMNERARFVGLEAWANGRQALFDLEAKTRQGVDEVRREIAAVKEAEIMLQQFAALKQQDFEKFRFKDIFEMVLKFVERLKTTWNELDKSTEYREIQRTLLTTACVKVIWGGDHALGDAFRIWHMKAEAFGGVDHDWNPEKMEAAIKSIFSLFDTDGGGQVDWREFQKTLDAMGVHSELSDIQKFLGDCDEDGTGLLEFDEFEDVLTKQIESVFKQFVGDRDSEYIVAEDLVRVSKELDLEISMKEAEELIIFLDRDEDMKVYHEDFHMLILMTPEDVEKAGKKKKQKKKKKRGEEPEHKNRKSFFETEMAAVKGCITKLHFRALKAVCESSSNSESSSSDTDDQA